MHRLPFAAMDEMKPLPRDGLIFVVLSFAALFGFVWYGLAHGAFVMP